MYPDDSKLVVYLYTCLELEWDWESKMALHKKINSLAYYCSILFLVFCNDDLFLKHYGV